MPCFARLCECVRCFARKHSIYIYILYIYIHALLCKAVRMYTLLCKDIIYIYISKLYYIYIYALLCKAVRMYSLFCKEMLYIFI